ncbi:DUF4159 domain-containing protein [Paracraurococcus lichenis]|uniref:DUF4159 domain-containing protein n=1 Tax=Paracraurococcus lichenis TaxID=3064888 RepID=A0ABT9E494_9PROT|nr:DUF4159 domain-containing protein [Paracraurococcus sp. LOR1-02]MDO9710989.1 DUF4159 domain-containing protein [Paracraurococcus sp. LOR1-02]
MLSLGPIAFAAPWLLLALPALPILWWLLRVTPPAPRRIGFPALRLLRDLPITQETPARTPWWLLLLRIVAAALLILGLAQPVLGPRGGVGGEGTQLLVLDDGWAAAADWPARMAAAGAALDRAAREGRRAALLATAPSETGDAPRVIGPMPAEDLRARLAALRPKPWAPDRAAALAAFQAWRTTNTGPVSTLLVSDGIEHAEAGAAPFQAALAGAGTLTLAMDAARPVRLLPPPVAEADRLRLTVQQRPLPTPSEAVVLARTGDGRALAQATVPVPANAAQGEGVLELPVELRNQVVRLEIEGETGAGGVVLLDERFRRRPVGLLPAQEESADAPLIGDLFYLDRALAPFVEIRRGPLDRLLSRPIAVLALADRPVAEGVERDALTRWVERGGTLIRFAGPRIADHQDPLLPVPLRAERSLGGSLSWEQPQRLAPFPDHSPFLGLPVPAEVTVERQVLAEPSPRLSERTWARLADGTPLVTAEARGQGRIVLFHVTANAEWSNLPLSGLFVQMLRRIVALSAGIQGQEGDAPLAPLETLDGFGRLGAAPPAASALPASAIEGTVPSPRNPPGWYGTPGQDAANAAYRRALNLGGAIPGPRAAPPPPPGTSVLAIGGIPAERDLGPWLLAAALLLLAADLVIGLVLRGLLAVPRAARVGAVAALALLAAAPAMAQRGSAGGPEGDPVLATRLAYVVTGDSSLDETQRMGLVGLSDFVNRRTAAALADPAAVTPGQDDLSFYPLLYWVITPDAPQPDAQAVTALNDFMRHGGIILFDTRDEGSGEGFASGARAALRRVTRDLAIPPLAQVSEDHVLRRAFYLLVDLPGRFAGGPVWVARDQDRANDSVSPVIIGGHDWAAAWAIDARGNNPFAVVPGGTRQRTLAYRFGVNLVMYALTGNYKGDQVHVPAILERLGN